MSKNVLVISSTLRKNGNSEILSKEFAKGAKDGGHNIEFVSLQDKEIKFCKGCLACQKLGHCVIQDDSNEIVEKMKNAEVIAFASPVYYYEMAGQLKTLLDRGNALYPSDYKFRDIYFIATSAEDDAHAMDTPTNGLKGWIACYPKCELKGVICGTGVDFPNDIQSHTEVLKQAYEMGKNV